MTKKSRTKKTVTLTEAELMEIQRALSDMDPSRAHSPAVLQQLNNRFWNLIKR